MFAAVVAKYHKYHPRNAVEVGWVVVIALLFINGLGLLGLFVGQVA